MKLNPTVKNKKTLQQRKTKENPFTVVAIGASSGGLEAVSVLLKNLPSDTGMAFIYVQHLSPDHKSSLPSILSKITKMKVQEIENMEEMVPDNVYIIPHNKIIEVTDGHIKLLPRPKNSSIISIDVLFSSLAETHKENVIGIILSGNASDGKIGLMAIKNAGGITFAQDDSALVSSMPKAAIALGAVDYILSPKEIALQIINFSKSGLVKPKVKVEQKETTLENGNYDLNTIFELLIKEKGVDFSHYKIPSIKRRLNNKMQQCGAKTIKEYVKLLLKKNNELASLYDDLLINVTHFFRDTETFKYLKTTILPKLLKNKTSDDTIRIWIPACSTGQEAYSIAMLLTELQDHKTKKIPVRIFATDLSEQAINDARTGEYSQNDLKSISKKNIERFFVRNKNNYGIVKELREMCVFATHNILSDPPFSRMDFISCRNLLIYFNAVTQKKVFSTLHFGLNENGYLMLGNAETIGNPSSLFSKINSKYKIFSRKKNTGVRKILELPNNFSDVTSYSKKPNQILKNINGNPVGLESAIDSFLLSNYMPACAVINKDMEILQFRGPISLYLIHPSGKASLNILKITRSEFVFELRNAINNATKTKKPVIKSGIEMEVGNVMRKVTLEVSPLEIEWDEPLLLIVFKLQDNAEKLIEYTGKNNSTLKDLRIKNLIDELNVTRNEMKTIIESQEATFEELQAANEEIVSSNEEFQTLNEELETSKEEIESTNEELISSNHELQMRHDLLIESNQYSEALIATIHEPMLVLHKDFKVKSANKSFYEKFKLKKEEVEGQILFELGNRQWNIPKLQKILKSIAIKTNKIENFELIHTFPDGEKIMIINAHLIIQKINSEQLILLAIADVTELRNLAFELQKKENAKELRIINTELLFQNKEKEKRAAELIIANKELAFQNEEKEKRAAELIIANKELAFQSDEKEKRAAELIVANYARSLIEASLDPLVTINSEGKITDVNQASIKATGVTRSKLIGTDFSNYFTEPEKAQEGYLQVFEKGFVADYPLTIKHKNETLTDVLYNASVYKDDKGNVLGVFAAARDVTKQKRIEKNLEESLKEISDYKYALDEFSIVAITDQKGIIKHANDNFCEISKYDREELIGKDHRIINSGFHSKEFIRDLWTTIANGKIWRGELKNKAKDGTIYWVNTTIVPFLNEVGKPYQYVAVRTDITEQKRIAAELNEAKVFAELATVFAETAQSKAESATLIAEDAVKAKQQFLSNMSHEIRTPMNAIIGFTKVVLKTDLSAKQTEYLNAIKTSGDALIVLINDILDLAKVDSGKMTFEKTPFNIAESISAMLHLFEPKIQEKNLELVKKYDYKIPEVLVGDAVRLHQIILNLVSNAVKFTNEGKIIVSVKLVTEDEDNVAIEFAVSDTGIGIPKNETENIFANFQQASSSTSRLYGGTGLGLAIVKQLVELQGGIISLKSKINEGSTFSFILTFQKTKDKPEEVTEILEFDTDIKNIKVLVVEDIELNQLLMKTLLDDFGFERDIASNGKIAIEKLLTKSYDIILMDLQMPEMNGFEATEYIRKKLNSKIPIIALTADVTTVDLEKCKAVGMSDYIAKPVDDKLLYSKILSLVKKTTPIKLIDPKENAISKNQRSKCIDLTYLNRLTKSNPKLIMEMISLYIEQTQPLINIINLSLKNKDINSLHAAVHKLIPSFAIIGISKDYENMAKRVQEIDGAEIHTSEIHDLVSQLENVCIQACKELEEELIIIKKLDK